MALLAFQNHKWRASSVSAQPTLTTSLVSYWNLDEAASATRVDSHGSNDLSNNGSVGQTTTDAGDNAAAFLRADSEYLSISDASQSGLDLTSDFSIFWVGQIDSFNANANMICFVKNDGTGNQRSWFITIRSSGSDRFFELATSSDGVSTSQFGTANISGTIGTTGVQHTFGVVYDASAGSATFYVDGSSVGSTSSLTTSLFNSSAPFHIGAGTTGGAGWEGYMARAGVWSRTLSAQEITDWHNSGAGLPYA